MQYLPLGNTGLTVTKPAMGCLPLQRCDTDYAVRLLQAAYEGGIRYFDTANAYTDSEKKIGLALADVRDDIVISTKSHGRDKATVLADIENSLKMMKTDYIDLFQFHQVPSASIACRTMIRPSLPSAYRRSCSSCIFARFSFVFAMISSLSTLSFLLFVGSFSSSSFLLPSNV